MPDYAALRTASGYRCRAPFCGSPDVEITHRDDPEKPVMVRCRTCKKVTWPPRPGNESRRRDHNSQHRQQWRDQLGELICAWCRVRDSETRCEFQVDHIKPLEFGGADSFSNTMMLCRNCHTKRHADQAAVRHLQNRSARAT